MNKLVSCLLALFLGGCASPSGSLFTEDQISGQFCHSDIHSSVCLFLKADHTFTEEFADANGVMPDENGVIRTEGRLLSSGHWKLEPGRLMLTSTEGKVRKLQVLEVEGAIRLHEKRGRFEREYYR